MELRVPLGDRLRRVAFVAAAIVLGVAMAALLLRIGEARGTSGCAQAYAAARTGADSAIVDVQASGAAKGRLDAANGVSCGELRLRGRLH
jgi:hypothetical protein